MATETIDLFKALWLPEMEKAALEVLQSGRIASGPNVAEFEKAFAAIVGRDHVVSTSDLTSSVSLALHLAGVGPGDKVATVAFSCLQSNSPITRLGGQPVWIDIDPATMSMSLDDLEAKLTPEVKAVMVYHIAGYPSDVVRIGALCRDRGVHLIEDCNNALGATLEGRPIGSVGDYATYSLYPNRQINGIDGGMLATPDAKTAARAARLRRFGLDVSSFRDNRGEINPNSDIPEIGWSAALSNLNAAIALSQLGTLSDRSDRTKRLAKRLKAALSDVSALKLVRAIPGSIPAFWGFLVLSEHRDSLLGYLKSNGVNSSILHQRNDWYAGFGVPRAELPGTAAAMNQILALPCGYWLSDAQADLLIDMVLEFHNII